ncbi:PD40 domain-containing protein [Marinihelvus fidelis]|uniref:PD40 domain-containing protein n=1 Tax=Marinihelvus fidelis TaxID=2613842 RepID=UPI0017820074|nr:PD40 domain-containing protein [Marinihelvus fidelis]
MGSWKEIANYLGKTVRTVQRWEEKEGLPVRRLVHESGATVFAFEHEIDRWLNRRSLTVHEQPVSGAQLAPASTAQTPVENSARSHKPALAWVLVSLFVVAVVLAVVLARPGQGPSNATPKGVQTAVVPELLTTSDGVERFPALSPDGRHVAYIWDGGQDQVDLYVRLVGADGVLRLTDTASIEESPAWSPDGDWLVFLRRQGLDRRQLVMVSALGGAERPLGEFGVPRNLDAARTIQASVDWSPDSRTLVVTEGTDQPYRQWLTLVDIESGDRTILTDPPPATIDLAPAFSPDGKQLAFTRSPGPLRGQVQVIDLGAGQPGKALPRALPGATAWNTEPAWTPDGRSVVFASGRWPRMSLWQVSASGEGEPMPLVAGSEGGDQPSIRAVDGGATWRLVYAQLGFENDVWAVDLANGEERRLFGSTQRERFPYVWPDGRIAFISDRSGHREIWVVDAEGQNPQQWTDHRSSYIWHPDLSAAHGTLAYEVQVDGRLQAYLRDAPLGPPRPVFDEPGRDYDLAWSNDGHTLYVASMDRADGQPATWAVRPGEHEPRVVTTAVHELLGEGPDGRWLYMAEGSAEDKRLLRVPTAGGEPETVALGEGTHHSFTLGPDGAYFLAVTAGHHEIRRWDWYTGEVETLQVLARPPEHGMAITRDGRHALLARIMLLRADLMQATLDAPTGAGGH